MTINHGLYTDTAWAVPVAFSDSVGQPIDLSGHAYLAELIGSGAVAFTFRSAGATASEGFLDLSDAANGVISFSATISQHQLVAPGLYRIHLKRDLTNDIWTAEGTMLIGQPGAKETYIKFDDPGADAAGSMSYAQLAAASATAAAADAIEAALSAGEAAASATAAATSATAAAGSATSAAGAASSAHADAIATAADRVQTGLDRTAAAGWSSAAAASQGAAATSATAAASSATASETSRLASETARNASQAAQTSAETARDAAVTAKTAAQTAQTAAETARSGAQAAQAAAETSRDTAQGSATSAAASASTATIQASTATTKAGDAATSATAAATAKTAAETARDAAAASATAAASSASAAATSATAAQTARTGAETAQTGAQAARTGAEAAQAAAASSYASATAQAMTSTSMASLAAGYAASAASVVQQDLSGVSAQALHRSPNAITAMCVYNTQLDSDGGAWTEKCQHTSWWNEGLNGKWLGPQASEAAARAVSGATTGDYFQLTTDGKFYRLWKNRLFGVTVNPADASGLTLFGDASATLTVVDDAAALAAAGLSGIASNAKVFRLNNTAGTTNAYVRFINALTMGSDTWSLSAYVRGSGTSTIEPNAGTWTGGGSTVLTGSYQRKVSTGVTNTSNNQWRISVGAGGDLYFVMMQAEVSATATVYESNTSTGSISEVFRGNKADFPRLAAIVAEAANVTIYDLTEPGRPMWMRFILGNNTQSDLYMLGPTSVTLTSMSVLNGVLAYGSSGAFYQIDIIKDRRIRSTATDASAFNGVIAQRNYPLGQTVTAGPVVVNITINAVAMTVLPDAPLDPVTGLRVPTIAVATGGGVSVIKHDGTVVNSGPTSSHSSVSIDPYMLTAGRSDGQAYVAANPGTLTASFAFIATAFPGDFRANNSSRFIRASRDRFAGINYTGSNARAQLAKINQGATLKTLVASINSAFNTGWMTGDIRRAYLADAAVESVSGGELVTNGTFDTYTTGWTGANYGALTVSSGALRVTNSSAGNYNIFAHQAVTVKPGSTYIFSGSVTGLSGISNYARLQVGGVVGGDNGGASLTVAGAFAPFKFTPTTSTIYVSLVGYGAVPGGYVDFDNISVKELALDRSYKAAAANITGTLTKAQLASGTSLVGYSGFSAANYLRETYSADLDFGTAEWSASAWFNTAIARRNVLVNTNALSGTGWSSVSYTTAITATGSQTDPLGGSTASLLTFPSNVSGAGQYSVWRGTVSTAANGTYTYSVWLKAGSATAVYIRVNDNAGNRAKLLCNLTASWQQFTVTGTTQASISAITVDIGADGNAGEAMLAGTVYAYGAQLELGSVATAYQAVGAGSDVVSLIFDRALSAGPRLRLAMNGLGYLTAEAYDGTTTRTVTTTAAYNTATWMKAEACYTADGGLSIRVNGREVAVTRGTPLLTLTNTSAVLTIGNSYALDAPFPGSIALLKLGATVPTYEQSQFMYEQEKQLFRAGAQSVLPDSGSILDMAYDEATDRWIAVTAANESHWTGLVRNDAIAVPSGSYSKVAAAGGVEITARSTTNPGVDITIPAYGLREELVKRAEAAARLSRELAVYDYVGGFTANTTNGSTAITSVAGLTYPGSYIGARISGSGIPANTTIIGVSGTTLYLSAAATATATGVSISFLDFTLPVGMEAKAVMSAGALKQEGATKDWTRLFDGFMETTRFGAAPGATAWVQIQATKGAVQ